MIEIYEDTTYIVIENVKNRKSELGILYLNDFNQAVLGKLFQEYGLKFHPLFDCRLYVYLWKGHPLAGRRFIHIEELMDYPCLSFSQGGQSLLLYFFICWPEWVWRKR